MGNILFARKSLSYISIKPPSTKMAKTPITCDLKIGLKNLISD